jgi:purine-binding chemotaxis protein CheW
VLKKPCERGAERKKEDMKMEASSSAVPSGEEEGKIIELIVFNLGEEEFGADIDQVREIITVEKIASIPDSPNFIKGVTNVRGEIAVVIDLATRFSLPRKSEVENKHIVITEQEKNLFGLMVDEVTEVQRIPEKVIKATPKLVSRIDRIYISGVLTLENRLIILLDLAKVLLEQELAGLAGLAKRTHAVEEEKVSEVEDERGHYEENPDR